MIGEVGHGRSLLGHRTAGMLGQRTMMLGWHRMIGLDGGITRRSRSNAALMRTMPAPLCWSNPAGPMSFAVALRAALMLSCVAVGFDCLRRATAPARIGVAADVPLSLVKYPVKCVTLQKSGLFGSSAPGP